MRRTMPFSLIVNASRASRQASIASAAARGPSCSSGRSVLRAGAGAAMGRFGIRAPAFLLMRLVQHGEAMRLPPFQPPGRQREAQHQAAQRRHGEAQRRKLLRPVRGDRPLQRIQARRRLRPPDLLRGRRRGRV